MKLFKCNDTITSYKYPILKIIFSVVLIILLISRDYFIGIDSVVWDVVITVVTFPIFIICVLCIYLAFGEMLLLSERRANTKKDINIAVKNGKYYHVNSILSLIEANDILDVTIFSNNQMINLGVSSETRSDNSRFFNRSYYVDKQDPISFDTLKEFLTACSIEGKVFVIAIDNMTPDYFNVE